MKYIFIAQMLQAQIAQMQNDPKFKSLDIYISIDTIYSAFRTAIKIRYKNENNINIDSKCMEYLQNVKPDVIGSLILGIASHYKVFFNSKLNPFNTSSKIRIYFYTGNGFTYITEALEKFRSIFLYLNNICGYIPNLYSICTINISKSSQVLGTLVSEDTKDRISLIISKYDDDWVWASLNPLNIVWYPKAEKCTNYIGLCKRFYGINNFINPEIFEALLPYMGCSYAKYVRSIYDLRRQTNIKAKIKSIFKDMVYDNNAELINYAQNARFCIDEDENISKTLYDSYSLCVNNYSIFKSELNQFMIDLLDTNIEVLNETVFVNRPVDFKSLM